MTGPVGYWYVDDIEPLPISPFRVRHDRTERSEAADRTEATLANEPTENADRNDPIEAIERTDPTEPIDRIEPREPTHKIEFSDLIDSNELRRVVTWPIMVDRPASQPDRCARAARRHEGCARPRDELTQMAPDQWSGAIRHRS
jgi:hypothetical protein